MRPSPGTLLPSKSNDCLPCAALPCPAPQAKLLEHNVRFGDPECQSLMVRLQSDLLESLMAACRGERDVRLDWSADPRCGSLGPHAALCCTVLRCNALGYGWTGVWTPGDPAGAAALDAALGLGAGFAALGLADAVLCLHTWGRLETLQCVDLGLLGFASQLDCMHAVLCCAL